MLCFRRFCCKVVSLFDRSIEMCCCLLFKNIFKFYHLSVYFILILFSYVCAMIWLGSCMFGCFVPVFLCMARPAVIPASHCQPVVQQGRLYGHYDWSVPVTCPAPLRHVWPVLCRASCPPVWARQTLLVRTGRRQQQGLTYLLTYGDSDVISFDIRANWFSTPSCGWNSL